MLEEGKEQRSLLSEATEMAESSYLTARADRDFVQRSVENGRRKVFFWCFLAAVILIALAVFVGTVILTD